MFKVAIKTIDRMVVSETLWPTVDDVLKERTDHYYGKPTRAIPATIGPHECFVAQPVSQTVVSGPIPTDRPVILIVDEQNLEEILREECVSTLKL